MKKLLIFAVAFVLVALGAFAGFGIYYEYSATKLQQARSDLEGKYNDLSGKFSDLEKQLAELSGEQEKTDLDLQEVKNREVVRQKSQDELLTAAVARVAPVVVSVVVSKDVSLLEVVYENPFGNDPFFKDFDIRIPVYRQKGVERQKVGAGTGFLISSDGYVVTNRHVVSDQEASYTVLLADGKQKEASVVYRDPNQDIAFLKIPGSGYGYAVLGNSDSIKLGQTVVAIGNALGEYNNSVSVGIVSGLDRNIEASGVALGHVIQTDAAINPGNSGGPLLGLNGQVVGVNVATVIGSNSISFSLPINAVKPVIKSALGR